MKISTNEEQIICDKYIQGIKVSVLAQEYEISTRTIRRILSSNDIKLDRVRANTKFSRKKKSRYVIDMSKVILLNFLVRSMVYMNRRLVLF